MAAQKKQKCPSIEQLRYYNLGKLSEKSIETISNHIQSCTICEANVEKANDSGDWLVANLQMKTGKADPKEEAELKKVLAKVAQNVPNSSAEKAPANISKTKKQVPKTIGDYKLVRKIGQGGMGDVYEAVHTKLGKRIALKLLRSQSFNNKSNVDRFEREMKAVGKLDHPNIVRATDAGELNDIHYLAMELVDGENLSEIVEQIGPMDVPDACEVIRQTAIGLQHAHEHGLIHRDLKASNLMLTNDGCVKILDLGLARLGTPIPGDGEITNTGIILGTIDYMAPEQITDPRKVSIRSDLYSLGCTLFKLLSGHVVFPNSTHSNPYSKMYAHQSQPIPDILELRDDVPEKVADIIDRLVAKNPDDRYATPQELVDALEPFVMGSDLREIAESIEKKPSKTASESTVHPMASLLSDTEISVQKKKRKRKYLEPGSGKSGGFFFSRRDILISAGAAGAILLGILLYFNTGEGRIAISINEPDVKLSVDGTEYPEFKFESPNQGPVLVTLPAGKRILEITKDGFKTREKSVRILRNGIVDWEVNLLPVTDDQLAASKPKPDASRQVSFTENNKFRKRLAEVPYQDPFDEKVIALRKELIEHERKHHGEPLGVDVSRLMSHIAWPVDALKHEDIPEYERARLGNGVKEPRGMAAVVGVLGDSRMMQWNHVVKIFWMPDGKELLTIGQNGETSLWNTENGEQTNLYWINYYTGRVAELSPDGKLLAVPGDHGQQAGIKFIDSHTGEIQFEIPMADLNRQNEQFIHGGFTFPSFSPDGKFIAVANSDHDKNGNLTIWNIETKKIVKKLDDQPTLSAEFSPDGKLLASGDHNGVLKMWDLESGKTRFVIEGLNSHIYDIAFSPDGNTILVESKKKGEPFGFRSYNTIDGSLNWEAERVAGPATHFDFHPEGSLFYTGSEPVALWDASKGRKIIHLKNYTQRPLSGSFSPDGKLLATGGYHGDIRLWNTSTGREILPKDYDGHQSRVSRILPLPDGETIATGGVSDIQLWKTETANLVNSTKKDFDSGMIREMVLHPSEPLIGIDSEAHGGFHIWNYQNNSMKFHESFDVISLSFHPDKPNIYIAGGTRLSEYDTKFEQNVKNTNLKYETYRSRSAFSPDGKTFVYGDYEGNITIYDIPTFKIMSEHKAEISDSSHPEIVISPDGQTLAFNGNHILLLDLMSGEERPLSQKIPGGFRVAFSPDGKYLAVAGNDVTIHDLITGESILKFALGSMWSIAFTPDSRHVITGNANGTAYIIRLKPPESISQVEQASN